MKVFKQVPIEEWVKKEPKEGWKHGINQNGYGISFYHSLEDTLDDYDFITHVLEEVELSELIKEMMPSEEEIHEASILSNVTETAYDLGLYNSGARWLRDKLLNKTNE